MSPDRSPDRFRRGAPVSWVSRCARVASGDEGIGLILVLGYAIVITLVITVSFATVNTITRSGTSHVQYGQAGDSAEAGVDQTLARVQYSSTYNSGVAVPAQWTDGFPDSATERSWVLNTAAPAVIAANASAVQKTAQGEYLAIRPSNAQSVYSIGWEPSRVNAKRVRVLRNDYLFTGYNPTDAILTAGDIAISGSFTLSQNTGTVATPNVHTEGTITKCSASLTKPAGTKIGGVTGGCGTTDTSMTVPVVDPRALYTSKSASYSSQWYDLCPDGKGHSPSTTPCTGAVLGSSPFRGWSYSSGTWSANTVSDGIYYVYQGNAELTKTDRVGGGSPKITVITESTNNLSCGKTNGNIHLKQSSIVPAMPFVTLFSGGNATLDAQSTAGDVSDPGLVAAQENLDFQTSSANGVVGAVIGNNRCGGANNFQGTEVRFDASMTLPFPDTIRSSLQTELY
jgi:hypothetical protein